MQSIADTISSLRACEAAIAGARTSIAELMTEVAMMAALAKLSGVSVPGALYQISNIDDLAQCAAATKTLRQILEHHPAGEMS